MEHYIKFMITLSAGLAGLGMVLVIVMDTLLLDYDAPAALGAWMREALSGKGLSSHRAEDVLMAMEKSKENAPSLRLIDQRREALRELDSVERRLQGPLQSGPIVITPLPVARPE
jgi:hypothetical protein